MVPGAEVETSPEEAVTLTPSAVVVVAEAVVDVVVVAEVASTAVEAMNSLTVVATEVAKEAAEEAMVAETPCVSPTSSTLRISTRRSRCAAYPSR